MLDCLPMLMYIQNWAAIHPLPRDGWESKTLACLGTLNSIMAALTLPSGDLSLEQWHNNQSYSKDYSVPFVSAAVADGRQGFAGRCWL